MRIRTVLCPVDFSGLDRREIGGATELCRAFDARLVLHHNVAAIAPGFARAWDWDAAHHAAEASRPEAERRMRAYLAAVPSGVRAEATVTSGPVAKIVLALAEQLPADLIVLGSHGWSTEEHASVTERLIERAPCPVLTFDERSGGAGWFPLRSDPGTERPRVVVPTDLSRAGTHVVAYACALARVLPVDLDLLHVTPAGRPAGDAYAHLDAAVPPDLVDRVTAHVRSGDAVEEILAHLEAGRPAFTILGDHTRDVFRRLFTRDTTRQVLHRAACPVWVVPPTAPL